MNFITKAPVMLCGGDYNPDQWLDRPDILEADIRMMKKAGMNSVTLGVFAWAAYEPREGEYNFTWLREIMDRLHDQGIYTELATPTGAKPNWLARKYPEVLRVQSNGVRDHQGMRHNHCLTSPIYRQKVEELVNHLIDAVGDHPGLILWHISNELGGECYCPLCQERFRGWLKEKYRTIDALNHAWWTSFWSHHYDSFDEVEPPFDNGEQSLNGLKLDWRRFTTWNMMDYVHSETAILRKRTPNVPITTNLMEYFPGLDYHKLQRELDFVCWDSYPHWGRPDRSTTVTAGMTAFDHALIRGCKPDKPFLLMESTPSLVNWHEYNKLKRPGVNRMSAIQTVACGADGVQYFQWRKGRGGSEQFHGAVVDHDGRDDTRVFNEVTATNEALAALTPVCGSLPKADAAMIFDWDNRWALDDAWGMQIKQKNLRETCCQLYAQLNHCGVETDVVGVDADLNRYKLVVLPMLFMTKPGFAHGHLLPERQRQHPRRPGRPRRGGPLCRRGGPRGRGLRPSEAGPRRLPGLPGPAGASGGALRLHRGPRRGHRLRPQCPGGPAGHGPGGGGGLRGRRLGRRPVRGFGGGGRRGRPPRGPAGSSGRPVTQQRPRREVPGGAAVCLPEVSACALFSGVL